MTEGTDDQKPKETRIHKKQSSCRIRHVKCRFGVADSKKKVVAICKRNIFSKSQASEEVNEDLGQNRGETHEVRGGWGNYKMACLV